MKNSTDKVKKAKGPIRTGAILGATMAVAILYVYFHFFFDGHLRRVIEWTGGYVHGAEVNVGSVKTSVFGGFMEIRNIQVTDKTTPTQNLIAVGKVRFELLWDALLRAKMVVNDASIEQIEIYSPRKRAGWVKPPEPPSKGPSQIQVLQDRVLNQVQDENSKNVLGDLAKIAGGTDSKDVLAAVQGQLQAEKKIQQLQTDLKQKEAEWKKRFDTLPNKQELEKLGDQAKALKFNTKDPKGFAHDLKELNRILKEADHKVDLLKSTGKDLNADLKNLNAGIASVDDLVKADINDIENRLSIPKLDAGSFAKAFFARLIGEKLASVQKYMAVARQYMPPPKSERQQKEEPIVPRKRGEGRNYRFPVTTGYPLFWLKKSVISSKATASGFSGDVEGRLTDVSSDPTIVRNPTLLQFKGDFPHQGVSGVFGLLTLDHRTSQPKENFELVVGGFPLRNLQISDSSDVKLAMTQAAGDSHLKAELFNQKLAIEIENNFHSPQYDIQTKSSTVKDVLSTVLAAIPVVTLNANATGTWDDLSLHINSNMGSELSAGFSRYLKQKTDQLKQQIRTQVESRIQAERGKLNAEYAKLKGQLDSVLKSKQAEVDKAKNNLKAASKKNSSAKEKTIKDLKQKGKELLKGLKF